MNDKLSYRDITVYTFNGLIGLTLISLVYRNQLLDFIINNEIHNQGMLLALIVPISYLINHIVLGLDNLLFMKIINKNIRKKLFNSKNIIKQFLHLTLYSHRIAGVRDKIWPDNYGAFNDVCAIIQNKDRLGRADKYYVLSDTFKGLIIIELTTIILSAIKLDWNYFFVSIFLLVIFYNRATTYSNQYVYEIIRQKELLEQ